MPLNKVWKGWSRRYLDDTAIPITWVCIVGTSTGAVFLLHHGGWIDL